MTYYYFSFKLINHINVESKSKSKSILRQQRGNFFLLITILLSLLSLLSTTQQQVSARKSFNSNSQDVAKQLQTGYGRIHSHHRKLGPIELKPSSVQSALNPSKKYDRRSRQKIQILNQNRTAPAIKEDDKFAQVLRELQSLAKSLAAESGASNNGTASGNSIPINGRKFDQVNPVACVDEKFFNLLQRDLELVDPEREIDSYGSYYDYEYAKAIGALIDTPQILTSHRAETKTEAKQSREDPIEAARGRFGKNGKGLLQNVEEFWAETIEQYNKTERELEANQSLGKNPQKALANHHYLLSRLESLKVILLNGEEALIALNNRVKKLNRAVGQRELQAASCNCVASRAGKAALMLMNELFTDKNSSEFGLTPGLAAGKAKQAALDTAEYCSYWYGDTIRSQAVHKEKLIRKLALQVAAMRRLSRQSLVKRLYKDDSRQKLTKTRERMLTNIVEMSSMWTPGLVKWINETLDYGMGPDEPVRTRRSLRASDESESAPFSTPFDLPSNYAEFDNPHSFDVALELRRKRRDATNLSDWPSFENQTNLRPALNSPQTVTEFEYKSSRRVSTCANEAFSSLLSLGYDQNVLLYGKLFPKEIGYIRELDDTFAELLPKLWIQKRDLWAKTMTGEGEERRHKKSGGGGARLKSGRRSPNVRSVDEEIEHSLEPSADSYDRGARLGFTIGKFIGAKAANQWPDPAELNTFTYDSIFLAGVAQGYSESDTKALERRIVAETAKRVAFTEASRAAFGKALQLAYMNGAYVVPLWGVLHAQRAIANRGAKEGSRVGFEAASRSATEFTPKATKFFQAHEHERSLAAPYKSTMAQSRRAKPSWPGLGDKLEQVQLEGELNWNITRDAVDCGQKAGLLMGALLGIVVTPEAFEAYTRFRGSLEALENEFNKFKLGAMRGYELGETWAQLNYTAMLRMNLMAAKNQKLQLQSGPLSLEKKSSSEEMGLEETINANNVFQFMIPNYGPHLIANHSHEHMLKIRPLIMDDSLIEDIKFQTGDLSKEPGQGQRGDSAITMRGVGSSSDSLFEVDKESIGELRGIFNVGNKDPERKPLKLNVINLGTILELTDSLANDSSASKINLPYDSEVKELEESPLTADLGKIGKSFVKFNVARRKGTPNSERYRDPLMNYLNTKLDVGDGYLYGTYSKLPAQSVSGAQAKDSSINSDGFDLEAFMLDQLFHRIEKAPPMVGTINLIKKVSAVTTMAPRIIKSQNDKTTTTTTSQPTTTTTTTTSQKPTSGMEPRTTILTTKSATMNRLTGSSTTTSKPSRVETTTRNDHYDEDTRDYLTLDE